MSPGNAPPLFSSVPLSIKESLRGPLSGAACPSGSSGPGHSAFGAHMDPTGSPGGLPVSAVLTGGSAATLWPLMGHRAFLPCLSVCHEGLSWAADQTLGGGPLWTVAGPLRCPGLGDC